jgi:hypothetical protein
MSHSKYDEYARLNEQIKELTARKDSLKAKMTLNDEALAGYLREHDIAERHYMAVKVCHKKLQSLISNGLVNSDEVLRFVKIEPYDVLLVGGKEEP